ncbi:MAG: TonB family protein [Kangiellaceae bacterium]|nr:TonB family protein [Kangiellaceae bacterium]
MARVLLSALMALGIVIGLFLLMNALISSSDTGDDDREKLTVDLGFVEEDREVQRKERKPPKKPPPPKEPPPPQQQQQQQQQKVVTAVVDIQIDDIDATMEGTGIFIGGLGQGQTDFSGLGDGEAIPQYTVPPSYPVQAQLKNITGHVKFRFDIGADGTPTNISVIEEKPRGVFRKEARQAIRKWKFKPRIVNGSPVVQKNMTYTIDFTLDE